MCVSLWTRTSQQSSHLSAHMDGMINQGGTGAAQQNHVGIVRINHFMGALHLFVFASLLSLNEKKEEQVALN